MKANYLERVEIDVLEEPQLDFKYYVNPIEKRSYVKLKKNEKVTILAHFVSFCFISFRPKYFV